MTTRMDEHTREAGRVAGWPDGLRSTIDETEEAEIEAALAEEAPKPTPEFRRRAWEDFQAALDRHGATTRRR